MKTFISSGTGFFTVYHGEKFDPTKQPDVSRYYLIWPTEQGWKVRFFDYSQQSNVGASFDDEHLALASAYDHFICYQEKNK